MADKFEASLQTPWNEFVRDCQRDFPQELNQAWDIDTVRTNLSKLGPKDDPKRDKRNKNLMLSLECVKILGGVLANFGSYAFPPAQICGNAITMVIEGVQKSNSAFGDVAALMERMTAFLETLSIHVSKKEAAETPKELSNACDQVLRHFLIVLKQIYKLTHSTWERVKTSFKVVFLDDNVITAALEKMEAFIGHFTNTSIATILEKVSDQARNIIHLQVGVDMLVESQTVESVERALNVGGVGQQNELRHDSVTNERLEGTGTWFTKSPAFKAWISGTDSSSAILTISEASGSGKTALSSLVVRTLQITRPKDALLAYFYFPKEPLTRVSLGKALRCLVWQLAQGNENYAKQVSEKLKHSPDLKTPLSLWQHFILDTSMGLPQCFLILDGLSSLKPRAGDVLARIVADCREEGSHSLKLHISGLPDAFPGINRTLRAMQQPVLQPMSFASRLNRRNTADIAQYVNVHLKGFQWNQADKDLVTRTMADTLNSDDLYLDLRTNIRELNQCLDRKGLEKSLDAVQSKTIQAAVVRTKVAILQLEKELGAAQISELNLVIAWVQALDGHCNIDLLEEGLSLSRTDTTKQPTMVDRLEPYSRLISMAPDGQEALFCNSINVAAYLKQDGSPFKKLLRFKLKNEQDDPQPVPANEVEIMRTFLKTFCKPDLYERFGFDAFFDSKLDYRPTNTTRRKPNERVQLDINRHVVVAEACLRALTNQAKFEGFNHIHTYSRDHLARHLNAVSGGRHARYITIYLDAPWIPAAWQTGGQEHLGKLCRAMQKHLKEVKPDAVQDPTEQRSDVVERFLAAKEPETVLIDRLRELGAVSTPATDVVVGGS